ncbi:MAG: hypothetical protein HRT89_22810 [Lentisphaeria bacterium]|nr:hypothetical protein [Lentisphaeria bacterium]NQZ70892.1 hypothetical protein [Lentisphaeria bacterium]
MIDASLEEIAVLRKKLTDNFWTSYEKKFEGNLQKSLLLKKYSFDSSVAYSKYCAKNGLSSYESIKKEKLKLKFYNFDEQKHLILGYNKSEKQKIIGLQVPFIKLYPENMIRFKILYADKKWKYLVIGGGGTGRLPMNMWVYLESTNVIGRLSKIYKNTSVVDFVDHVEKLPEKGTYCYIRMNRSWYKNSLARKYPPGNRNGYPDKTVAQVAEMQNIIRRIVSKQAAVELKKVVTAKSTEERLKYLNTALRQFQVLGPNRDILEKCREIRSAINKISFEKWEYDASPIIAVNRDLKYVVIKKYENLPKGPDFVVYRNKETICKVRFWPQKFKKYSVAILVKGELPKLGDSIVIDWKKEK